jgi:hypothetical protein
LIVSLPISPAAITTIIVSPMARLTARGTPPTMSGMAAGNSSFVMVSPRVAPSARDPSRSGRGTADRASSVKEEMKRISMIAMTLSAASAVPGARFRPKSAPVSRRKGAAVRIAKKPQTTVGKPDRISSTGLMTLRVRGAANSMR